MNTLLLVSLTLAGALVALALVRFLATLRRQHGSRLVACPETHEPAAVNVDALGAALSSLRGKPNVHLETCSRWPERADCGQECLGAIQSAPDGCLVRALLVRWYAGKLCTLCGADVDPVHWYTHEPAFLDLDGRVLEWRDIPVQELPQAFETHRPICWNCLIIESVIHKHPERVVYRP